MTAIQEEPPDSSSLIPAQLVERVSRTQLPWVVVPASALTAWKQRDPPGWAKVSAWLGVKGVTIVRI